MAQDIQGDVESVSRIEAVPTILDVVRRTTGMRFAAVARVPRIIGSPVACLMKSISD